MAEGDAGYLDFDDSSLFFECVVSEQAEHTATATDHNVEQGANVSDHVRPGLDRVTLEVFVSNTLLNDPNGFYGGSVEGVEFNVPTMKSKAIYTELDVPTFKQKLAPTPGALINAVTSALGDLISGKQAYKAGGQESEQGSFKAAAQVYQHARINQVKDVVTQLDAWRVGGVVGKIFLPWKAYESVVITKVSPKRTAESGDAASISIEFKEIRLVESMLVTAPKPTETRGQTMVAKGRQPTTFVRDTGPKASTLRKATK